MGLQLSGAPAAVRLFTGAVILPAFVLISFLSTREWSSSNMTGRSAPRRLAMALAWLYFMCCRPTASMLLQLPPTRTRARYGQGPARGALFSCVVTCCFRWAWGTWSGDIAGRRHLIAVYPMLSTFSSARARQRVILAWSRAGSVHEHRDHGGSEPVRISKTDDHPRVGVLNDHRGPAGR